MRNLLLAAAVLTAGAAALVPANADDVTVPAQARSTPAAPEASGRVHAAFTLTNFTPLTPSGGTGASAPAQDVPPAAQAQRPAWYAMDRSLQRGDIVVRDGDALVYEGVKNGKRHFRTITLSRLVSNEERDRIMLSVRR